MPSKAYGRAHQLKRALMLPDAVGKPCRRCGKPMLPGQALDAGHPEGRALAQDPSSRADAMEHASCNRAAGATLGNSLVKFRPSRAW